MTVTWATHPHDAEGYLFILKPTRVFEARVNLANATYPLAEIPFDGVTTGAYSDVQIGMTVLIGSAAGKWDRGRIYVRADGGGVVATASTLHIGYCSRGHHAGEIDLVDNSYITVLDLYEPWRRASRMSPEGVILKDYDLVVPYLPAPVCQMGGAGGLVAAMDFVTAGALAVNDLSTAGSYVTAPSGTLTNPFWYIGDGTFTAGLWTSTAPDMSFPPGARWISVLLGDTNGRTSMPRRALVIALETSGANAPVSRVSEAAWHLAPEGVSFNAKLRVRLDPADYVPGTVVAWMVKERRAGAASNLTGYQVKFAGYLDYASSFGQAQRSGWERVTTIYAVDAALRHKQLRAFPSALARESTVYNANQMQAATIDRYVWWMLSWHTFWPMLSDFQWSGDTTPFLAFSSNGGDFQTVADNLARARARRLTMDSRGRTAMPTDPLRVDAADRTSTVLKDIAPADITRIDRLRRSLPRTGVLRATFSLASTTNASELVGDFPDLNLKAPGDVEGSGGGDAQTGYPQLAASEAEGLARVGHDYARENSLEVHLRITLAHGGDAGIEAALLQWVTVTTDADTVGWTDEALDHERCLVLGVDYRYDDQANAMTCSLEVERESEGTAGVSDPVAGAATPEPVVGYDPRALLAGANELAAVNTDGYRYLGSSLRTAPAWTRTAIPSLSGNILDSVQDAFTLSRQIVVTTTGIYTVESFTGTMATTLRFTFRAAITDPSVQCREVDASFGADYIAVKSYYGSAGADSGTWECHSLDGGLTWSTEVRISAYANTTAAGRGLFVSSRHPGEADMSAFTSDSAAIDAGTAEIYSGAFASLAAAGEQTYNDGANCIHRSWADSEATLYYGTCNLALDWHVGTTLLRVIGGVTVDISLTFQGHKHRPYPNNRALHTCPLDASTVLACLYSQGGSGVAMSRDKGDTWTLLLDNTLSPSAPSYAGAEVAGDSADAGWLWGGPGAIATVDLAAQTITDISGNLLADFPAIGTFVRIRGL